MIECKKSKGGGLMAQKYTEARKAGNQRWDAANLDRLSVALPKGYKNKIQCHAKTTGETMNGFIKRAITETLEREEHEKTDC